MSEIDNETGLPRPTCPYRGCASLAAIGQKYCSKEHAPYGHLVGFVEPYRPPRVTSPKPPGTQPAEPRPPKEPKPAEFGAMPDQVIRRGEVNQSQLAFRMGISHATLTRLVNKGVAPCRMASNGYTFFKIKAVEAALIARGWAFDADGKAIRKANWKSRKKEGVHEPYSQ